MNPVALVTGASSGIGAALVDMLLEENYEVYGIGRTYLNETTHRNFHKIVCDLKNTSNTITQLTPLQKSKSVSLLINCAGVGYYGLHEELNAAKLHEMVTINLEIPMLLTQMFLKTLKQKKGTIINISSVTATKSNPHGCAYGATKAALSNFSNSLFEENRKYGLKVINIQPDMTKTNLYRNANFQEGEELDTYLLPTDVSEAVRSLLYCRPEIIPTQLTLQPQRHQIRRK